MSFKDDDDDGNIEYHEDDDQHEDDEGDSLENRMLDPRSAFAVGDHIASRVAHDLRVAAKAGETHNDQGKYLKPIIYGALDGITTTFAVVAAVVGGGLPISTVLIMGFANLFADGLSMGLGDWLSGKAENEYVAKEYAREQWETENYLEGEQSEMIELYEKKGMTHEDAQTVVMTMSKYKDIFVDTMMVEELGLLPPEEDEWEPLRSGAITFASFLIFGAVPLLFYIVTEAVASYSDSDLSTPTFILSTIMTAVTLFVLGVVKTRFTAEPWWKGGLMMLINGSAAAIMSFLVSVLISKIVPPTSAP